LSAWEAQHLALDVGHPVIARDLDAGFVGDQSSESKAVPNGLFVTLAEANFFN
jgi:hypothetical protein